MVNLATHQHPLSIQLDGCCRETRALELGSALQQGGNGDSRRHPQSEVRPRGDGLSDEERRRKANIPSLGFVTAVDEEKSALKHKKRKHSFQLHFMLPSSMTSTALVLILLPVTVFLQNLFSTVETS